MPPVEKAPPLLFVRLTCTDENFVQKAGRKRRANWNRAAADTCLDSRTTGSCRAKTICDFERGGVYVDAHHPLSTTTYSFVTQELPEAVMVACLEVDVQTLDHGTRWADTAP